MYLDSALNEQGEFEIAWHSLKVDHIPILSTALAAYQNRLTDKLKDLESPEKAPKPDAAPVKLELHQLQTKSVKDSITEIGKMLAKLESITIKPGIHNDKSY
jgi:hypothetical protein